MLNIRLILFLFISFYGSAQITVDTDTYSVEQLIQEVLLNSNCAQTSNYSSFTGTDQGVHGIGYFNANDSGFQFQEGIVLSTGSAVDSQGPNNRRYNTKTEAWEGDTDLSSITGKSPLFNASHIQFQFVPKANSISFNFLFASEEYADNYQCSFSDVFAFILTGPDGVKTNLAVIPDTDEPVSTTTIRSGIPGLCEPTNEDYFFGINGANSPISQYGQTISLTARAAVVPLDTYTIKLVIADNLDSELDSAVYLEAGSFSIDVSLGEDRTVTGGNPICDDEAIHLDAFSHGAIDYIWYRDGIEMKAKRNQSSIEVVDNGAYAVEVVFSANCISNGAITLEYITPPTIAQEPIDLSACIINAEDPVVFDFSENTNRIFGEQDTNLYSIQYYNTLEDAENSKNKIGNTNEYESKFSNEVIYARVSSEGDCFVITNFEINVQQVDFTSDLEELYTLCLNADGSPKEPLPVLGTGLSSSEYIFQWYRSSVSEENMIAGATEPAFTAAEEGTYIVQIGISEFGCSLSISTMVRASRPPESIKVDLVSELFATQNVVVVQVDGLEEYHYSIDSGSIQESNRFSNIGPGEHTVYITDINGCTTVTKDFFIIDYPRFFTPNADGNNDIWSISGLNEVESPEITIYDRTGKLLYQFFDLGWDGTLNGKPLPSSDYWFRISYIFDGSRKEFKGHFSLKR